MFHKSLIVLSVSDTYKNGMLLNCNSIKKNAAVSCFRMCTAEIAYHFIIESAEPQSLFFQ